MANFTDTLKIILRNEGGYNCAFTGSGETYKGIDRNYSSNWQGWQIIDNLKRTGRVDAQCRKRGEQYIYSSLLDKLVTQWYATILLPYFSNYTGIRNQTLATFLADFVWHKPYRAIAITNSIVQRINPGVVTNSNYITQDAINTINRNSTTFYTMLRNSRIAYYKNPQSFNSNWSEVFTTTQQGLLNRVNSFPKTLTFWSWLF